MAELKQFKLPDVGEGLTEADILRWDVKVGDTVTVNQTLVEVETAKAAVELPSPYAGVVHEIHYDEGATVDVGQPIITIAVGEGAVAPAETTVQTVSSNDTERTVSSGDEPPKKQAVLVGYGVSEERGRRRRRAAASVANVVAPVVNEAFFGPTPGAGAATALAGQARAVLAKPPVRKLAKTLGIDLATVLPTGPNGTISREDVEEAARTVLPRVAPTQQGSVGRPASGAAEERIPIKGVRKHMAAAMVSSAFTAPHVTEFVTVDVSAMMDLRDRVAARREFADVKVSPLLFVARAVTWAARRTPIINSTWDDAAGEIVVHNYVNLGIAAATERGLIVPNIKNADALSLLELARALTDLTDTARAGKTAPADMAGGTFTITNVGVFGVDTGTPIINPGEAAILAFGAVRRMPWVVGTGAQERIEPRWVTQLGLSFDHRSVDGQAGSQFLSDVATILSDPGLALL